MTMPHRTRVACALLRLAGTADRSLTCRIAGVAQRILMHSLAYSIDGLMATMIAELVCILSL